MQLNESVNFQDTWPQMSDVTDSQNIHAMIEVEALHV